MESFHTSGQQHTSEFREELGVRGIEEAKTRYGAELIAIVADKASNMTKMRKNATAGTKIVDYGIAEH